MLARVPIHNDHAEHRNLMLPARTSEQRVPSSVLTKYRPNEYDWVDQMVTGKFLTIRLRMSVC